MAISKKAQTIIKIVAIILVVVIGMGIAVVSVGLLFMSPMTLFLALGNAAINTAEKNNSDADVIEAKHYRDTYVYTYDLIHLSCEKLTVAISSSDSIFKTSSVEFYSIPGVPTDNFVVEHSFDPDDGYTISVSIKNRSDYSPDPIANWKVSKVEFYWFDLKNRNSLTDPTTYGKDIVKEIAFSPEHEPLVEHIRRSVPVDLRNKGAQRITKADSNTYLKLRFYFSNYENLALDTEIYVHNGYYYINYESLKHGGLVYIPLSNAVSAQLDEYLKTVNVTT